MTCWYDPIIIISIGYIVDVVSVNMILYYFLVILYIIYIVVGYDAGIILYCIVVDVMDN